MILMSEKRQNTDNRFSMREKIADAIDISKDIIMDTVLIRLIGTHKVTLENYKGILEYSDRQIKVRAKPKCVCIQGSSLEIICLTDELLNIRGYIEKISFVS